MDGRPTWTDCDEAGDYVVPNVLNASNPAVVGSSPGWGGHICACHIGV